MKQYLEPKVKASTWPDLCLWHRSKLRMSLQSINYLITNNPLGNPVLDLMQLLKKSLSHPQSTKEKNISIPLLSCATRSARPPSFLLQLRTESRTPCELVWTIQLADGKETWLDRGGREGIRTYCWWCRKDGKSIEIGKVSRSVAINEQKDHRKTNDNGWNFLQRRIMKTSVFLVLKGKALGKRLSCSFLSIACEQVPTGRAVKDAGALFFTYWAHPSVPPFFP